MTRQKVKKVSSFGLSLGIDTLDDIGCFALTELGYGNNAVEMETTAIYDDKTDEIIVNTPHPLAQKYWITNGAVHAKHAVVMAQLYVREGHLAPQWFKE